MNLANLLLELKPLVGDPEANWDRIVALLAAHQSLAEYEVARHYVTRAMAPRIDARLKNPDPRERVAALRMLPMVFARSSAARVLRPLVKDADPRVRSAARHAVRALGLDDVALPDQRLDTRAQGREIFAPWNPSGWSFGLFPYLTEARRAGRKPPAEAAAARGALPPLDDADAVAALVGLAGRADLLRLMRPGTGRGAPYVSFEIPKATGGARTITAPRAPLKKVQRAILREVLQKLPAHEACHGFVPGRSVVTNARPHEGAALLIKMDLKDFFPTVHYRRVVGLFRQYGYGPEVARLLAGLCTWRPVLPDGTVLWPGVLPQGAPTSPALANLLCRRLDARLSGLAARVGATYTRYADDLTFSFRAAPEVGVGRFLWWVDQICQQEGFVENAVKRRVLRPNNQQRVTGVVVNSGLFVPREARRQFRAVLANCARHGIESQARGRKDFRAYLKGFASYVKMVQPELGAELVAQVRALFAAQPAPAAAPVVDGSGA